MNVESSLRADSGIISNPLGCIGGGVYYLSTTGFYYISDTGYDWTSGTSNTARAFRLHNNPVHVNTRGADYKGYGYSIRYVAILKGNHQDNLIQRTAHRATRRTAKP